MKTMNVRNSFSKLLFFFVTVIFLYSCENEQTDKYGFIPKPSTNPYADSLSGRDHLIRSDTAVIWANRYVQYKENIQNNKFQRFDSASKSTIVLQDSVQCNSEGFNKQLFLRFFLLKTCIGIRITYGMDQVYKVHQIITGVDVDGNDLYLTKEDQNALINTGKLTTPPLDTYAGENGLGCPPKICN